MKRFIDYLVDGKDIYGKDVEGSDKMFYSFSDYNILIINEINNAAIKKYNELKKAEMDEKEKKTLSELETAIESSKNEILGVINSANDLEKIKNYSNKEEIKAKLGKIVKDKVADYDTKKAKFEKIDLFTNPVAEIEKTYKTKQNAIAEEKLKQQQPPKEHEDDEYKDEEHKYDEEYKNEDKNKDEHKDHEDYDHKDHDHNKDKPKDNEDNLVDNSEINESEDTQIKENKRCCSYNNKNKKSTYCVKKSLN